MVVAVFLFQNITIIIEEFLRCFMNKKKNR